MALATLRHRIITNFNAEAEGINSDKIIEMMLNEAPRQDSQNLSDPRVANMTAKSA